jgi:hypothetical protein
MSMKPIDILGGESVYCISEDQLRKSFQLAEHDPESSPKIQAAIQDLETRLNRNQRAALAFLLIDRLRKSAPSF